MRQRLSWWVVLAGLVALVLIASSYGYFRWVRFESLDEVVTLGRNLAGEGGSETDILLRLLESERASLREKNRAIWALGEVGESSALTRLRELDRFEECDHETRICVYELRKAIQKIEKR